MIEFCRRAICKTWWLGFFMLATLCVAAPNARAQTDQGQQAKADDKAEKKDEKKLELPKLPEGCKPKWDLESLDEKFTVVKGGITDWGLVFFLIELKEDARTIPNCKVFFIDGDGVKYITTSASCQPSMGKKGDRVRLVFNGYVPADTKDKWAKAATVRLVMD